MTIFYVENPKDSTHQKKPFLYKENINRPKVRNSNIIIVGDFSLPHFHQWIDYPDRKSIGNIGLNDVRPEV